MQVTKQSIEKKLNSAKNELVDWYSADDATDFDKDYSVKHAAWIHEKTVKNKFIRGKKSAEFVQRKRKYVYWCSLGMNVGSELSEDHFAVVISEFPSVALVVPLSSKKEVSSKTEEEGYFEIGKIDGFPRDKVDNYAVISQMKSVSKKRLSSYRDKGEFVTIVLSDEQMDIIDAAIRKMVIKN